VITLSVLLSAVAISLAGGAAFAQAPKGFDIKVLGSIDLGPEIDGMAGRVLRMSYVTVAPAANWPRTLMMGGRKSSMSCRAS
jgi:hypothetical protein